MAASAARSWGRRHEARRSRLVSWRPCAARPPAGRVRLRPASRPWPCWVGLAASGRKASSVVCARFLPAPVFRAPGLHKEAEASRGSWSVVSIAAAVLRAPASPCARPRLVLGRVVRGGPRRFFPEALAPGKGRASGRFVRRGRCHGPCFSALAKPRSALSRPAPLVRAGRDKARSIQLRAEGRENGIS